MNYAHFKSVVAAFAVISSLGAAAPTCLAGESEPCSRECSDSWSNCGVCRCCDRCCCYCDKICQFRLIDDCTKCAWSRTWHAPNALATPLRQYYVPRPPQCCYYNGCEICMANAGDAAWEMPADTDCPNRMTLACNDASPKAAALIMPVQFERLGKIPNELNVVGPIGAPASGRTTAPAH